MAQSFIRSFVRHRLRDSQIKSQNYIRTHIRTQIQKKLRHNKILKCHCRRKSTDDAKLTGTLYNTVFVIDLMIMRSHRFYRAMHFSAKRGIAIACRLSVRPSVRPSVRLSVCLSVTLVNCDHIGWNSSKIISPSVSLGCWLFATPT